MVRAHSDAQVEAVKEYYTNQQLYTMLKPDQMDSPYIYDNFEWSHCEVSVVPSDPTLGGPISP